MTDDGWFADVDRDTPDGPQWRPYLQQGGVCVPLEVWFAAEEDCVQFIRDKVLGRVLLP